MGVLQKRAHARLVADFTTEIEPSEKYLAFGFGLAGEIVVASRRSEESPTVEKEHGIFPKSQLEGASDYRVLVKRDEQPLKRIVIRSERTPCSFVQHVPDGLLMVGARCAWRVSGPEQNAVVFDESGKVVRRFTLGDGINDVRTDSKGSIWVSYFDEGVFGNRGWNSPGPEPIGASGLVAFDSSGQRIFSFDAEAAETDIICDAYATNLVGDDDVWVYFYTEFPIVRIHNGRYQRWSYGEAGANAMAVREDRVALFGDYKKRNRLRILALGRDGKAKRVGDLTVAAEKHDLEKDTYAFGVGGTLYCVNNRRVFALSDW